MSDLTDGLEALTQQRARATATKKGKGPSRAVLKPKHPARPIEDAGQAAAVASDPASASTESSSTAPVASVGPVASVPPAETAAESATETASVSVPLRRLTFYLDEQAHEWLEDIAFAGRRSKPRVDASRSAVVRLALERLMDQMGVDAVVTELQGRAQRAPDSPGRKRI